MMDLTDIRCPACGRMYGRFNGVGECVCKKCGTLFAFDTYCNAVKIIQTKNRKQAKNMI